MAALDTLLEAARAGRAPVSGALTARVLADADRVQAGFRHGRGPVGSADGPARRGWRAIVAALGGWGSVGGMVTAAAAGVWIGGFPPEALSAFVDGQFGVTESVGLGLDGGWVSEEG